MNLKKWNWLIIALTLILIIPIIFYVSEFGFSISQDHIRWAEFGSFASGIYTPFLSTLTIIILWRQNKLHKQSQDFQEKIILINKTVSQINHIVHKIKSLGAETHHINLQKIYNTFHNLTDEEISEKSDPVVRDIVYDEFLNTEYNRIYQLWYMHNKYLNSIDIDEYPYTHYFGELIVNTQYNLYHGNCVALDKMLKVLRSEQGDIKKLYFSDMLNELP